MNKLFTIFLFLILITHFSFVKGQIGRLPTAEEIKNKQERVRQIMLEDEEKIKEEVIRQQSLFKNKKAVKLESEGTIEGQESKVTAVDGLLDIPAIASDNLLPPASVQKIIYNNQVYTTGPEQDCKNAIPVCNDSYTQTNSYTGFGTIQELTGTTCLKSKEQSTVWYIFTVEVGGSFGFTLNTTNDYDFSIYDMTALGSCSAIPTATPVRCNFSGTNGTTGMDYTSILAGNESYSDVQSPIMHGMNVTVGNTYVMVIDNFTRDANGYTLTFTGTSSIHDPTPPTFSGTSTYNCNNIVTLNFSEPVSCASIAANGTDFYTVSGPSAATIVSATGVGCSSNGTTTQVQLVISGAVNSGTYTFGVRSGAAGTDGNTILDKCGNAMITSPVQSTSVNIIGTTSVTPTTATVCSGGSTTLAAVAGVQATGATYAWSPTVASGAGTSSVTVSPSTTTTYQLAVTYNGCTKTGTAAVTVNPNPIVSVTPYNPTICSGTVPSLTATATPCNSCAYSWSGGLGTASTTAAVGAGTYTCTITNSGGCVGSGSSTVAVASTPASSTCNIYYVTPGGAGTKSGTSIANAADSTALTTILSSVVCTGATIKMAVGVYNFSDNTDLPLGSGTYIEGGYKSDFTMKYSMDKSTTYTTIIRRFRKNPSSSNIIAFNVPAASSNFRLQDLMIELPGAASGNVPANAAGSAVSNYGVYLGAGCSSYNIVRCLIDAGVGGTGVNKTSKTYTGSDQTFTVPTGVSSLDVQLWGAGGGGGSEGGSSNSSGGSGGYVSGTMSVTAGSTLTIVVGQGGTNTSTATTYGGGGRNYGPTTRSSSGGGRSSIQVTVGTDAVTAGGGGGASGANINSSGSTQNNISYGGAGGGSTGGAGGAVKFATGGTGGSQVAGGSGGVGSSNGACSGNEGSGSAGASKTGGNGANTATFGGSGGGGGYYGGGGGAKGSYDDGVTCIVARSGGGGGSSYLGTLTSTTNTQGNDNSVSLNGLQVSAPNNGDANYVAGVGVGGAGGTSSTGGNGLVVLTYTLTGGSSFGIYGASTQTSATISSCEILATAASGGTTCLVCTPTSTSYSSVAISGYPVISAGDITNNNSSCTGVNMNMTKVTGSGTADWTGSSAPLTGSGNTKTVNYTATGSGGTLGRKDVIMNNGTSYTYTGFNNMIIDAPSPGTITSTSLDVCPNGSITFASSLGNATGFTYAWSVPAVGGIGTTISAATSSSTSITFTSSNTSPTTVIINLVITSSCCGVLTTVTKTITVNPTPTSLACNASPATICPGNSSTLTATAPASCSYAWYTASTGGSLLGSGATLSVSPLATTIYFLEATNSNGCVSARTGVTVTVTATSAPTVPTATSCAAGNQTLTVSSPIAGATYSWYTGSCGGTLQQASSSTTFAYNQATVGSTNIYVSVQDVANSCNASTCVTTSVTVSAGATSATWTGATNSDWFTGTNWSTGCIPACGTNVTIPNVANDPVIAFNAAGAAACDNISLAASAILTFADNKAQLNICGNFTHSGVLTMAGVGTIIFTGTTSQTYSRVSGATGDFFNVVINNTASTPILTVLDGVASGDFKFRTDGTLNFTAGKILTEGARLVDMPNSATTAISGHSTSSYIIGRLKRAISTGAYDFPLGNINAYELMNINFTATGGTNNVTTVFDNLSTAGTVSLSETAAGVAVTYNSFINAGGSNATTSNANAGIWTIMPDAGTPDYTMNLYGRNYSNTTGGFTIAKRSTFPVGCASYSAWGLNGAFTYNSNAANVLQVTRSGMSGFSEVVIVKTTTILPIELMTFNAVCKNKKLLFQWITSMELNSKNFVIQVSKDGSNFLDIATVTASGNTNKMHQYSYLSEYSETESLKYYRLKEVDIDGIEKFLSLKTFICNPSEGELSIKVVPNPTDGQSNVIVNSNKEDDRAQLIVYDAIGKIISVQKVNVSLGINNYEINLNEFTKGIYMVHLVGNELNLNAKIERK